MVDVQVQVETIESHITCTVLDILVHATIASVIRPPTVLLSLVSICPVLSLNGNALHAIPNDYLFGKDTSALALAVR